MLVPKACLDLEVLRVLLARSVSLAALAREESLARKVPWVHLALLGREALLAHKDPEEIKETLEIVERGARRVIEASPVYKVSLDHQVQLEIREHQEFLDQVAKEDLLDQWVHLEKKAI